MARGTNFGSGVRGTHTVTGKAYIFTVKYPVKGKYAKPSTLVRLIEHDAKRIGVSLMVVEKGRNGEPLRYQVIGTRDGAETAAVFAFAQSWYFHDYTTHNGPAQFIPCHAPGAYVPNDKMDDMTPIPKGIPASTAKRLLERRREERTPKLLRESRMLAEMGEKLPHGDVASPHHGEAEAVADAVAERERAANDSRYHCNRDATGYVTLFRILRRMGCTIPAGVEEIPTAHVELFR